MGTEAGSAALLLGIQGCTGFGSTALSLARCGHLLSWLLTEIILRAWLLIVGNLLAWLPTLLAWLLDMGNLLA